MRSLTVNAKTGICHVATQLSLCTTVAAGLALMAPGAARAEISAPGYGSHVIATSGARAGDTLIPADYHLFVDGLNDAGQVLFGAGLISGNKPELLFQYSHGKMATIVMPATGPVGAWPGDVYWPHNVIVDRPLSMNQQGNVVFSADQTGNYRQWGTFLWNAATQKVTAVALKDMPATGNLTFTQPGGYAPAINNHDEIALVGRVKAPGGPTRYGLFFLGRDGVMQPVLLQGQELPGGTGQNAAATDAYPAPSINDDGAIGFLARRTGSGYYSAYRWEHGSISPILLSGTVLAGSEKISGVTSVFLNNRNSNVLVTANTSRTSGRQGVYQVRNGELSPIAAPGQAMPGGGTLKTVQYFYREVESSLPIMAVSNASALGEHAFLATLEDGSTAAYRVTASGHLALIVKSDASVQIGRVAAAIRSMQFVAGSRPAINKYGQVALSVHALGGPDTVVVLSPSD